MKTLTNEIIYFSEFGKWGIELNEKGQIPECVFLFAPEVFDNFFWFQDDETELKVIIDRDTMICTVDLGKNI